MPDRDNFKASSPTSRKTPPSTAGLIAGSSYWSIAWINQEVREAMYSGITYSPHQYTVSELYAWTHGLQDYEAAKERVANYIKTAYSSRRGITDITATPCRDG